MLTLTSPTFQCSLSAVSQNALAAGYSNAAEGAERGLRGGEMDLRRGRCRGDLMDVGVF